MISHNLGTSAKNTGWLLGTKIDNIAEKMHDVNVTGSSFFWDCDSCRKLCQDNKYY